MREREWVSLADYQIVSQDGNNGEDKGKNI